MATEPEDIGQDVIILTEADQELQLNQEAEQVEREAQSELESFPILSSPSTEESMFDTLTTESSFGATSIPGLLQLLDETASPAEMSSVSQHPTTLVNSTIGSTEAHGFPHNISLLPHAYKESQQNMKFTFDLSEPESTTGPPESTNAPYTHNQTMLRTQPSMTLKESQATQEANLALNKAHDHYTEGEDSHTQDATLLAPDEAALEEPVQMPASTPKEEPEPQTQTTQPIAKKETSFWLPVDWSGDIPQGVNLIALLPHWQPHRQHVNTLV